VLLAIHVLGSFPFSQSRAGEGPERKAMGSGSGSHFGQMQIRVSGAWVNFSLGGKGFLRWVSNGFPGCSGRVVVAFNDLLNVRLIMFTCCPHATPETREWMAKLAGERLKWVSRLG